MEAKPGETEVARRSPRVGLRDWWIALPVLSIGVFTWAALFYVGLRARRSSWLLAAGGYLAILFAAFAVDAVAGEAEWSSTLAGLVLFALAGGGLAHCVAIRRSFYEAIGEVPASADRGFTTAQRRVEARALGRKLALEEPARARQLGIGRPDLDEAFDADLVDLNSAPAAVIAHVCGVDADVAERIVSARARVGEFSSVEDLDLLVDLPAATVARLKDAAVCVPLD